MITKAVLTSMPIFFTIGIVSGILKQKSAMEVFVTLTVISVLVWTLIFWFKMFGKIGMIL